MALTIVSGSYKRNSAGSQFRITGKLAFDSSYPTGGEAVSNTLLGLSQIQSFQICGNESGYLFDSTVNTAGDSVAIKVLSGGSGTFTGAALAAHGHNLQATVDEVVSVTAGTGVSAALTNIPIGNIMNVYVTAGGVTGAFSAIPAAATLATTLYKYNLTTGVLTFLIADAVTSATVTYQRAAVSTTSGGTPSGTIAAGAGGEVANGTNLSALTAVEFEAFGL